MYIYMCVCIYTYIYTMIFPWPILAPWPWPCSESTMEQRTLEPLGDLLQLSLTVQMYVCVYIPLIEYMRIYCL